MKWRNRRQSSNVDDRRSQGGTGGGLPSVGTILVFWPLIKRLLGSKFGLAIVGIGAVAYFGGFLDLSSFMGGDSYSVIDEQADDEQAAFIKTVLADTEAVWSAVFAQAGRRYPAPTLVLYRGSTVSGCGSASARMGPFYCPADQQVYIDPVFFEELKQRHNAPGDFAQAYVIAHEVEQEPDSPLRKRRAEPRQPLLATEGLRHLVGGHRSTHRTRWSRTVPPSL